MRTVNLRWESGVAKGYTDILPILLLQKRGLVEMVEHEVLKPGKKRSVAHCRVTVSEGVVDLDYGAFPSQNASQGMELGILRLYFANRDHTLVRRAEWKGTGDKDFTEAEIESTTIDPDLEGLPQQIFNKRDQKTEFIEWMQANPMGYILNWPKNGVAASMHVVFHKSGCSALTKKSFPTPQWHKICDMNLATLEHWAVSRKRFENDPSVHACGICFQDGKEEFALSSRPLSDMVDLAVDDDPPDRIEMRVLRFVRDTALARQVKTLHGMKCQLCSTIIEIPGGGCYAEAHHLKPLGREHKGPDKQENIMCVCPNCHAKLDYGVIPLRRSEIREVVGHNIGGEFIDYHNKSVFRG